MTGRNDEKADEQRRKQRSKTRSAHAGSAGAPEPMPEPMSPGMNLRIRVLPAIGDLAAASWDACANPAGPESSSISSYNPFIAHDFLSALEMSGSAVARTGWQPQHLVAETADREIVGVAPCYLKSHSRG